MQNQRNLYLYFLIMCFGSTTSVLAQTAPYNVEEILTPQHGEIIKNLDRDGNQYDGYLSFDLVNPANRYEVITFSFPTKSGTVVYHSDSVRRHGPVYLDMEMSTKDDFELAAMEKAKFKKKRFKIHTIYEVRDLADLLAWSQIAEIKGPNTSDSDLMPPRKLVVDLPTRGYTKLLNKGEKTSIQKLVNRDSAERALISLFPEKADQKFGEIRQDIEDFSRSLIEKQFNEIGQPLPKSIKDWKIKTTPQTTFGRSSSCLFTYTLSRPKWPTYNFGIALITVQGACVIEGVEFYFTRATPYYENDEFVNPAQVIAASANRIETFVRETKVSKSSVNKTKQIGNIISLTVAEVNEQFSHTRDQWREEIYQMRQEGKTLKGYEIDKIAKSENDTEYVTYATYSKPFENLDGAAFMFRPTFESSGQPTSLEYEWYFSIPIKDWGASNLDEACRLSAKSVKEDLKDYFSVYGSCDYVGVVSGKNIMYAVVFKIYRK